MQTDNNKCTVAETLIMPHSSTAHFGPYKYHFSHLQKSLTEKDSNCAHFARRHRNKTRGGVAGFILLPS